MFYSIIITITMVLMTTLSIVLNLALGNEPMLYAIFAPLSVLLYVLVILGILAVGMRLIIPKRVWNYKNRFFKVNKNQANRLVKIGIKKWKDKVPDLGWTAGFSKSTMKSTEVNYLEKFLQETCFAEGLHLTAGILGLTALFVFPARDIFITLPIVLVNLILHILPCLIQRYTRFRLTHVYERKLKTTVPQLENSLNL